jgi:hypothetical protein
MGRFYFNVRDGQTLTRDPTPYLFSTVQIARDSVIQTVRELLRGHAGEETLDEKRIEIADETGHPVSFVDVDDVRSNRGPLRTRENIPAAQRERKI